MLSRLHGRAARVSAAITFLLLTVSLASAQSAWTGLVSTIATDSLWDIDLAADAAGNAIAIWRTQSSEIRVAHFSAVAKTWAAPITLQGPSSYSPDIAMTPTGEAVALWSDLSAGQSRIRSARYSAASATWSAPVTLATTPSGAGGLQVAVDADGNAAAIWEALGGSYDSHLRAARYSAANGVWSAAADITPLAYNGSLAAQPRIVLDAFGSATAIFWTGNPPARALAASRSGPGSTSWSSPQALRAGAGSTPGSIAADAAGNVFAVWPSPVTGGSEIVAARYAAASGTWSPVRTLSSTGNGPQVVADDAGIATAVWLAPQSGNAMTLTASTYSASSDSWSTPESISGANLGGDIGLGVDGTGIVTVVWGRMNPAVSRTVMYAARRASGQAWSAPVALHEGEFQAGTPTSLVAASRNGDVTVLWSTFKSTRWAASGAEGVSAPTGLTLTTPRIFNNQAQAGERLTVSWSAPATGLPVTSYQLQAGTAPDANDLADLNVGATMQVVATVPAVRNVAVRVRALSGAIAGPWSNGTGFVVFGICGAPAVPAGLTSTVAGATVSFTWQPAGGSTSYVLEAGSASGLANIVATNVGIVTRFTAVAPPGTYYVRVRAEGNCGASGPSNEVVVTVAGASAPGVPVLQPPTVNGSTVTLTWSAGSGGAPTGYTLTASIAPGGPPIVTAPLSGTSASFSNVASGTYYLRLTASNAAGTSSPSAQVTLTVP